MGIDIYLTDHKCNYDSDTDNAFTQQRAYIRESYHGDIYPSETFLPESFKEYGTIITFDVLLGRIGETLKLAIERSIKTYNDNDIRGAIEPYINFMYEVFAIEQEGKQAWVTNSY
jgi:hypothetical protein